VLRPCFARPEPWLQAGKYLSALAGGLARRNGWTIAGMRATGHRIRPGGCSAAPSGTRPPRWARCAGSPSRPAGGCASWRPPRPGDRGAGRDGPGEDGHRHSGRAAAVPGLRRESGQRDQHRAPGLRARACRARSDRRRQWIPAAQIADPARSAATGLPPGLEFRARGSWPPPPRSTTCSSAATSRPASWRFTTGSCPMATGPALHRDRPHQEGRPVLCGQEARAPGPVRLAAHEAIVCRSRTGVPVGNSAAAARAVRRSETGIA
jgi:hypothetical protein